MAERGSHRQKDDGRWSNPLTVAVFAAAVAGIGNAAVAYINGAQQRSLEADRAEATLTLEKNKEESDRILEVIKTGNPDSAASNLDFLVRSGLITDSMRAAKIESFLSKRAPGQGPSLGIDDACKLYPAMCRPTNERHASIPPSG